MNNKILFNKKLIQRYDYAGPRYTSYPTAKQFSTDYNDADYKNWVEASNEDPIPAELSLYLHIPFCDTICYYCGCSKIVTKDRSKATPYIALLQQEIALQGQLFANDRETTQIHWGGGTPTFLKDDEIAELMNSLHQHFHINTEKGEFGIEVDPRTVNKKRIQNLRQLGFNRISFGIQDFNTNVQQAVNRVQKTEQIMEVIQAARDNQFESINIDLMYGLPEQTPETFEHSLDAVITASPDRLAVYNYAHMPEMFKPQRRINAAALPSPQQKLAILQLTIEKLQQAGYVYIGMDHFAKPTDDLVIAQQNGSLHRNFQGYSTHANCDIVAMGITAISRIGDNYSQNVRTIDEYKSRLKDNRLTIFRGIELEPDDVLRREIITQLMCNNFLDIKKLEQKWGIEFIGYFKDTLSKLHEMADDELITLTPEIIRITAKGRLLVRSICMQFDRYLKAEKTQQAYSRII